MKTARVFADVGGYFVCDDGYLDTRGRAYPSKAAALRAAYPYYTHATGSGCPWSGIRRIPNRYRSN